MIKHFNIKLFLITTADTKAKNWTKQSEIFSDSAFPSCCTISQELETYLPYLRDCTATKLIVVQNVSIIVIKIGLVDILFLCCKQGQDCSKHQTKWSPLCLFMKSTKEVMIVRAKRSTKHSLKPWNLYKNGVIITDRPMIAVYTDM